MVGMPDSELSEQVARLRQQGRTRKEIARALGLKPSQVTPLIRAAGAAAPRREAPLVGCWISDNWSAGLTVRGHADWVGMGAAESGESGLAGVLVAREHGSTVSAVGYLVDVWCLGVKNCNGPKTMNRRKLPEFIQSFFRAFSQPVLQATLEQAAHVVFGAVDYARELGLEPHPDFPKCAAHLGDWSGRSDITFGRDGMPTYIEGPHDDTFRIMNTLRQTVGDDKFHYLHGLR